MFKTEAEAREAFKKQHGEQPTRFELAYALRTGLLTGAGAARRPVPLPPPAPAPAPDEMAPAARPAPLAPPKTTAMLAAGPLSPNAVQNALSLFAGAKKYCVIHGDYFGEICSVCLNPIPSEIDPDTDPMEPYSKATGADVMAALDMKPAIVYHEPVNKTQPNTTTDKKEIDMAPPTATAPVPVPTPAVKVPAGLMASRALKRMGRIRAAISAPSGGGKTYGALLLAKGFLGKDVWRDLNGVKTPKILVVDTEAYSSADYGEDTSGKYPVVPFDIIDMQPDYTVQKYLDAYTYAVDNGYEVIIFDSLSHAWKGEGGMLEAKSKLDARGGGKFSNWQFIDESWNKFRAMILHSRIHLIGTMRANTEYVVDGSGRPTKVGMAPEMRNGLEFDFTIVFDLDMKHQAMVTKHRTLKLYEDRGLFPLTEKAGKELMDWRMSGAPEAERPEPTATPVGKSVV